MRENEKITDLFRSRLAGAELTVREGFWEQLQSDLPQAVPAGRRKAFLSSRFCRVAAAASVIFVLGGISAAFWYFSPKEEIQEAFTQVATMTPEGSLNGDVVQESFPSIHKANPVAQQAGRKLPASNTSAGLPIQDEDESVSLHVSITITQRSYGNNQQPGNGFYSGGNPGQHDFYQTGAGNADTSPDTALTVAADGELAATQDKPAAKPCSWAVKAGVGTALPKGDFDMPFTAGVSVERRLNKHLSLESGLQYTCLPAGRTLHMLAVPVKLNALLASARQIDFYATVGGSAEKCIAGAANNGFRAEPVQLSVAAGIGARYKMNDRFALFAETFVSHHFDTDSKTGTLRTERPTNLNLLCGVRMTY